MDGTPRHILTITGYFPFAKILLVGLMMSLPVDATSHELSRCGRALHQTLQGTFDGSLRAASCPVTYRLVQWMQLQKPEEMIVMPFSKVMAFFLENPNWPLKERIQLRGEENLKGDEFSKELIKYFDDNPPLTAKGATVYIHALFQARRRNAAIRATRNAWTNLDFKGTALKTFWNQFKKYLSQEDHQRRMNRLLMQEKVAAARAMFPWLNEKYKTLADARIALIEQSGDVDTKLASVPETLSKDPGLVYDRIKWNRRKENNSKMLKLFHEMPSPKEDEELWWRERNLLVRRLMDDRQYQDAYHLVKEHGLSSGENFATGEWLAGWIALRFLNRPGIALNHFQTLNAKVKTPISMARAAYWCARAALALGKKEEAKTWLSKAKLFPGTYYGQIALRSSVTGVTPPLHSKRPSINEALRQKFEQREMTQAIRLLNAVGARHFIEPFITKLSKDLTNPGEQILFIELAANKGGAYHGVLASKKLPLKKVPLIEAAYPLLPRSYHKCLSKANPALVHAIIRQESRFKADAISPAGAQGLMQLMPKTAIQTAKKMKARLGSLCDPSVNVPLGCAHLQELMAYYKGSLILAIAAYNAGRTAVDAWIEKYGDPREPNIDLIDWIETIPFAETRNYVQRVWENYAYYAQRLGKMG